jgi:hypothetical protein
MTTNQVPIRRERPGLKQEFSIIPAWAFVVAALIFVLIPFLFFGFVWPPSPETPMLWLLIPFLPATFLAFLAIMVGYVNRDAGRRGMNRTLWTLIVIFVPNAIGFIIYFLLRNPITTNCPKCGTAVETRMNYCPKCRYNFHPTCGQCKSPVRPGDTFCATCGAPLE